MKAKIMDINTDWERIKNEELDFLVEKKDEKTANPVMFVGGNDIRETTLKALVQQAARN